MTKSCLPEDDKSLREIYGVRLLPKDTISYQLVTVKKPSPWPSKSVHSSS